LLPIRFTFNIERKRQDVSSAQTDLYGDRCSNTIDVHEYTFRQFF
jgi:hypothetical protein